MPKIFTPIKAIREKCLDSCGNSSNEVATCSAPNCPLYAYRFGKRPKEDKNTDNNQE